MLHPLSPFDVFSFVGQPTRFNPLGACARCDLELCSGVKVPTTCFSFPPSETDFSFSLSFSGFYFFISPIPDGGERNLCFFSNFSLLRFFVDCFFHESISFSPGRLLDLLFTGGSPCFPFASEGWLTSPFFHLNAHSKCLCVLRGLQPDRKSLVG